jgi:hypothetical protein
MVTLVTIFHILLSGLTISVIKCRAFASDIQENCPSQQHLIIERQLPEHNRYNDLQLVLFSSYSYLRWRIQVLVG